jgi:tetratricopeptide (TPR) repeat protein
MIDMVLFFKNLDSLVDRWLSFKMKSAVDEQYFVEKHIDFSTLVASEQFNVGFWLTSRKLIYHYYKLGDFEKATKVFNESINHTIEDSLKPKINSTPSKTKKGKYIVPPKFNISDHLTDKEIKDIYKDALRSIKDYIIINEAARKAKFKYFDDNKKWIEYRRKIINSYEGNIVKDISQLNKTDKIFTKTYQADENLRSTSDKSNELRKIMCTSFSDKLELKTAISYFEVLKTRVSEGNSEPFLTDEQFELFINVAFRSGKLERKIRINQKPRGERMLITKVFYTFYTETYEELFGFQKNRDKYIELLTDNFLGFKFKNIKNNFNKNTRGSLSDNKKYIRK